MSFRFINNIHYYISVIRKLLFILYKMGNDCKALNIQCKSMKRSQFEIVHEEQVTKQIKLQNLIKSNQQFCPSINLQRNQKNSSKEYDKQNRLQKCVSLQIKTSNHLNPIQPLVPDQRIINSSIKETSFKQGDYEQNIIYFNQSQQETQPILDKQESSLIINQQKSKIQVNWGSFIKIKKKNYALDYQIIEELGKGAFGTVNKVKMKSSGLTRAMKTIKKSSLIEQDKKKIFAELSILKNLDHPNILKLFEIYDWKNYYYLITQLCQGGQLFQQVKQRNHFTQSDAMQIMRNLLSAVIYMHKYNIAHRDLKPQNLMFMLKNDFNSLKIIDFGTSKKIEPNTKLKKLIGTVYYIAPQVLYNSYDVKCDVWSCGIILYILLCGYPPFRGTKQSQIIQNIKHNELKFQKNSWSKISDNTIQLIKKMLNKKPNDRINAQQAYNSIWFQHTINHTQTSMQAIENLKNFYFKNKLKAVVLTYIASQLYTNQDKMQLQKVFKQIDLDGDGLIEKKELIKVFQNDDKNFSDVNINNILKLVDTNNSGKIDYTEFLVAASSQQMLLNLNRVENAFKYFDVDGSGYITINEIKNFLNDGKDSINQIQMLFKSVDLNNDGQICLSQFKSLLLNMN